MNELQCKEFKLLESAVDFEQSTFEGSSAGIGNKDSIDDIIHPGAFSKTIRERVSKGAVKLLDQHNRFTTKSLWGKVLEAEEKTVGKITGQPKRSFDGASHLLWTLFQVSKSDEDAQTALHKVDERILDGLSIGFKPTRVEYTDMDGEPFDKDKEDLDPEWEWLMGRAIRQIKELAWWESSFVIWGANKAARPHPSTVKSLAQEVAFFTEHGEVFAQDDIGLLLKTVLHAVRQCENAPEMLRDAMQGECPTFSADTLTRYIEKNGLGSIADELIVQEANRRFADMTIDGEIKVIGDGKITLSTAASRDDDKHGDSKVAIDKVDAATDADAGDDPDVTSGRTSEPTQEQLGQYLTLLEATNLEV